MSSTPPWLKLESYKVGSIGLEGRVWEVVGSTHPLTKDINK